MNIYRQDGWDHARIVADESGGASAGWSSLRAEFPALENWTYLNTATYGQMPRAASVRMQRHLERRDELGCGDFLEWFDNMDAIRASCGRLLNGEAQDIAFVVNAATGLATLLQGLRWQPGDEVLTFPGEFPNLLYISTVLQRFGVTLRPVAWPEFYQALNERTRLVVLSTVNYATGWRPPLEEISERLRRSGILLYVDGSQSVGALQFDTQRIRPSALCVDAYKWMLSPNGAGFLYVDPELREQLPPAVVGWRSDRHWRSVDSLNPGDPVVSNTAEKYEGGMLCFPSLYGMGAVIDMLLEIGPARIEARVIELAGRVREILRLFGAEANTDRSPLVTATLPGLDPRELVRALRERRIMVSARHGRFARFSSLLQ